MGTGTFPGVRWPGRGVDPPPSSDKVNEYICTSTPLLGLCGLYLYLLENSVCWLTGLQNVEEVKPTLLRSLFWTLHIISVDILLTVHLNIFILLLNNLMH